MLVCGFSLYALCCSWYEVLVFYVLHDDETFELLAYKKLLSRIYVEDFENMLRHNCNGIEKVGT